MIKTGFAKEIITPPRGISLAGYFNPRPNKGAYDELHVKTVLFQDEKQTGGIVSFDLCLMTRELIADVRKLLEKEKISFGDNLLFCATHTHTGPHISDFFSGKTDKDYLIYLRMQAVKSIAKAQRNLCESTLRAGSAKDNPFAFNRRYFMKDGGVTTNPGKLNPQIAEPEGTVDREIGILTIEQDKRVSLIVANIVNHTDTIGGDMVSADWPGRMEREVQKQTGYDVPVITLIGASGNINHFDVKSKRNQASYKEACKIGKGYAKIICKTLGKLKKLKGSEFKIATQIAPVQGREIPLLEAKRAKDILKKRPASSNKNLTSEDLAKGDGQVACFFADQLLRFEKESAGKIREFEMLTFKFDKALAITSMPGEPFTEIGQAIKNASPFKNTFIVSHGQGKAGYIPLKECFGRGGYETLPVQNGGCRKETAELLIKKTLKNLK